MQNIWQKRHLHLPLLPHSHHPEKSHNMYVTGFGKTLRMGFFLKIEFDVWLISSTIELTRVQVLG